MAAFVQTGTRQMEARDGKKFATVYIKLARGETAKMHEFVKAIAQEVLEECIRQDDYPVCNPLKAFPRTMGRENYSALDIMQDLLNQLEAGKDVPQAMINRWNKLFHGYHDIMIYFREPGPTTTFADIYQRVMHKNP
jgi:hypothetical protein